MLGIRLATMHCRKETDGENEAKLCHAFTTWIRVLRWTRDRHHPLSQFARQFRPACPPWQRKSDEHLEFAANRPDMFMRPALVYRVLVGQLHRPVREKFLSKKARKMILDKWNRERLTSLLLCLSRLIFPCAVRTKEMWSGRGKWQRQMTALTTYRSRFCQGSIAK